MSDIDTNALRDDFPPGGAVHRLCDAVDALRAELEASRAQVVAVAHMCRRLLAHARGLPEHGVTNDAEELLGDTAKTAAEYDAKVRAEEREQCKKVIWTGEPDGKCGPGAKWGWVARAVYDSMVRAAALQEAAKAIEGLPIWVDQDELRRGLNRAVDAVRALATPPRGAP